MRWIDKRYHTLNYELKGTFACKVFKLSIDGGFTCPNRDGKIGDRGCIFCSESGSGEFASSRNLDIHSQLKDQVDLLMEKWPSGKYIAYFQNFTNTYSTLEDLEKKYEDAISYPGVVGLAIATRPDCMPDDILELLARLSNKTYLWVELGLQTIHNDTAGIIRRGYEMDVFERTFSKLKKLGIRTVVHLILGLPGEDRKRILESVRYVSSLNPYGVKLHLMHVLKNTDLEHYYSENPFHTLSKDEYIGLICDSLEILGPDITVHRVTGDGSKDHLIAPRWSLDKRSVLNGIDMELKKRDSFQGKNFTG